MSLFFTIDVCLVDWIAVACRIKTWLRYCVWTLDHGVINLHHKDDDAHDGGDDDDDDDDDRSV